MAKQSAWDRIIANLSGQQAAGPYGGPSNVPMPRQGGLFAGGRQIASQIGGGATQYLPSGPYGYPTTPKQLLGAGILGGLKTFKRSRQLKGMEKQHRRTRRAFLEEERVRLPYEKRQFAESMAARGRSERGTQYKRGIEQIEHPWQMGKVEINKQRSAIKDAKKFNWLWG